MPPRGKAAASATADAPYALGLLADEMTEVLAGSVSLEFDMATACSLPSRNSPYNMTCANVIWKDKEAPHKLFSAKVKANELVFKRSKGADALVVGFCAEDQGVGLTPLKWLHVVDSTSLQARVNTTKKKKASNSVKPLKIGDIVTVKFGKLENERGTILGTRWGGWYSVQMDDAEDKRSCNFRRADLKADDDEDDEDDDEDDEDDDEDDEDDDEDNDEDDEEDDEEDGEDAVEIIQVGREHAILDVSRLSGITHIGLASARQKAVLEEMYYMNADDKGGGIQWMASHLGKLPAEITSQIKEGEPGDDDGRVKEEDSLLKHLAYMAVAPIDERRAELAEDYMRMMNRLVVDKFRKGTKGTEKVRLQLRLGYKALGEVLAHKVMPRASTSAAASACRVNLTSWTDIDKELIGNLQKAFKEAPSELRYDVPASLLSMLENDASGSDGSDSSGVDDLAPKSQSADEPIREDVTSKGAKRKPSSGAQKMGRGRRKVAKTSTLQHNLQLAPATQALAQALNMQIDQLKAEKLAAEAETARVKTQLKAVQEQLAAAEDAKRQTENRYTSDMAAWVGPFTSNMLKISTAQGDLSIAGCKVQAARCVAEPLPWDIKSRPFNADSASARKHGPTVLSNSFKFATKPRNLL